MFRSLTCYRKVQNSVVNFEFKFLAKNLLIALFLLATTTNSFSQWSNDPAVNLAVNVEPGNKEDLKICSDGEGGAILVWINNNEQNWTLKAQRLSYNGDLMWGQNGISITEGSNELDSLCIIRDTDNNLIATWIEKISGVFQIMARRVDQNGNLFWSEDFRIAPTSATQQEQQVAVLSNKEYVIVWRDYRLSSDKANIYAQRVDYEGTPKWSTSGLLIYDSGYNQLTPQLVISNSNKIYVYWVEKQDSQDVIIGGAITIDGDTIKTPSPVYTSPSGHSVFQIKVLKTGVSNLKVWTEGWSEKESGFPIAHDYDVKVLNAYPLNDLQIPLPPTQLSSEFRLQTSNVFPRPSNHLQNKLISDTESGALCAWEYSVHSRLGTTRSDIYMQRLKYFTPIPFHSELEAVWDSIGIQINRNGRDGFYFDITDDGSGGAEVVWMEQLENASYVYAQRLDKNGKLLWNDTTGIIISAPANSKNNKSNLGIISDRAAGAIVAWIDDRNGQNDVYALRILVNGSLMKGEKLTLSSPNGGENWKVSENREIRWTSENYTKPTINLDYSIDGGNNWISIEKNIAGSGPYLWTVPDTPSLNCLVRVSDPEDGITFDMSDTVFSILKKSITVISPNGGEKWLIGSIDTVKWTSENLEGNVKIEYSINGGSIWNPLYNSTDNDEIEPCPVPSEVSSNCYIKITDVTDENTFDQSNGPFSIVEQKKITVISPNGDESWRVWDRQNIKWTSVGLISNVKIELSRNNRSSWETLFANTENDGSESWRVQGVSSINCLIRVTDVVSDTTKDVSDALFTIKSDTNETSPVLRTGEKTKDYQIISIPVNLVSKSPSAVLFDDLGSYNKKKWRLFDFDLKTKQFREYPETGNFEIGKGFFLIVKDPNKQITSGKGNYINSSRYSILLYPGWNLVGNPYPFSIPANSMSFKKSGVPMESVYIFEAGWSFSTKDLNHWQGFAIYSESEDSLIFQIQNSTPSSNLKESIVAATEAKSWKIQILANCQNASDVINYLGVSEDATAIKDKNDLPEPPPFGEYVSVYFSHPEWNYLTKKFTTDLRGYEENGYIWDFEVISNLTDKINLTFLNIEKVPFEFHVWLKDDLLKISQDLRLNNNYEVAGNGEEHPRQLKLIVGRNEFIDKNITDQNYLPDSYELCQNFPNPFNPSTTIRYGLPQEERVLLKVYNILGDEIVTLVANELQAKGYHVAIWDGRDQNGKSVANGIYMYKFKAGKFLTTKKMLLMK